MPAPGAIRQHIYMTGAMMGYSALQANGLKFSPIHPYRGCLICGTVFQSGLDRLDSPLPAQVAEGAALRQAWALDHADTHTEREHLLLTLSGRWCTPEAACKLATLGIYALGDMVLSPETADAMRLAPRAPSDDVEGPLCLSHQNAL